MDTGRPKGSSGNKEVVNIVTGNFKEVVLSRKGQRVFMSISGGRFVGPMIVEDYKTRLLRCPDTGSEFHYLGRFYSGKDNSN